MYHTMDNFLFSRYIKTIILVLIWVSIGHGQVTIKPIRLIDTINTEFKISFTGKNIRDTITLDDYNKTIEVRSLSPSNFFWNDQYPNINYYLIEYSLIYTDTGVFILTRNNPNADFVSKKLDLDNDYIIDFIPKNTEINDTLSIRNKIRLHNKLLSFYPMQMYTGDLVVNDTIIHFQVWPFQTGPFVHIFNDASAIGYDRYEMDETFLLDSFVISFTDFSFTNKSIQVSMEKLDSEPILYGYKVGRRVKGWTESSIVWDSLGINRDMPLMIYFGASWCPPCLQELPRLKKIANICSTHGISVLSAAGRYKDSRSDALEYLSQNGFPGNYYTASLYDPISLNKVLNISSYPTYVFINSEGEILFRAESKGQRDKELNSFISSYITLIKDDD